MAGAWTNRGKYLVLQWVFQNVAQPGHLYVALVTAATDPTADTNTMSELTEIAAGNGYTSGGYELDRNATDWTGLTQDDINDKATVTMKNVAWTAAGGTIPASGDGARWAVLIDDNIAVEDRQILAYFDLGSARSVSAGQTLTLVGAVIQGVGG